MPLVTVIMIFFFWKIGKKMIETDKNENAINEKYEQEIIQKKSAVLSHTGCYQFKLQQSKYRYDDRAHLVCIVHFTK